jgi:hypothetical protein
MRSPSRLPNILQKNNYQSLLNSPHSNKKMKKYGVIYIVFPKNSITHIGAFSFKAFEFRKFWGKKSEVRRFQDGSISESVVWNNGSATLAQKRMICHHIVTYLLNEKFGIPSDNGVIYVADQLDSLLERCMVRRHLVASCFNLSAFKRFCAAS